MKFLAHSLIPIGLLCFGPHAHAEGNCPDGYYPIGAGGQSGPQGCALIPNYDQTSESPTHWKSNWGAIATDIEAGAFGTSTYAPNRDAAEKLAIMDCKSRGGKSCKIETWFANACVATSIGDKTHSTNVADTKKKAEKNSMKACKEADENCHIYYSDCSPPIEFND